MEIIGLLIAFVLILGLVIKRVNLGIAMLVGSIVIGLTSPQIGFNQFFKILRTGVVNQVTFELVLMIINITLIANVMKESKMIDQIIDNMLILFKRFELILMMLPSIMGVLAIPGGAVMSAPMVDQIARDLGLSNSKKLAINLLFRHIWYFIFPFVPGLILTAALIGVDVFFVIRHMFPLTLVMGIAGYLTLFRGIDHSCRRKSTAGNKLQAIKGLLLGLLPLLLGIFLPLLTPLPFWLSLLLGLIYLLVVQRNKIDFRTILRRIDGKLPLAIVGIMAFKEFIGNLSALPQLADGIVAAGMPVWLLAIFLPGLIGFITGASSAAIGISLPLFIPLIGDLKGNMGYLVLIYYVGFFSYYLSPLHFCLLLTVEYFGLSLKESYRYLYLPMLAGLATAILLFFIY